MRRLVVIGVFLALMVPSPALAAIRIWQIYYNPAGADSGSNSHLNKEYIVLKNTGTTAKSLGSWYVTDRSGNRYTFGSGYRLGAGKYVRIHSGSGTGDQNDKYWGAGYYVWGNNGDTGRLYNSGGTLIDTCKYGSSATSPYRC